MKQQKPQKIPVYDKVVIRYHATSLVEYYETYNVQVLLRNDGFLSLIHYRDEDKNNPQTSFNLSKILYIQLSGMKLIEMNEETGMVQ